MSKASNRFSLEVRVRPTRLVFDHGKEHSWRWAVVSSIAVKMGCTAQSFNEWVKQGGGRSGVCADLPDDVVEKLKARLWEDREPRQANEILR